MIEILKYAISNEASDIHITEGKECWVRVMGTFFKAGSKIKLADIDEFIIETIPQIEKEYKNLRENRRINPIDGAFKYMKRRFRMNIYRGMNGINIAVRLLSDKIPSIRELHLPEEIGRYTQIKSGLFLVVGTTGSGKSTTLASMIDGVNHTRSENILTIEQPIEYIHKADRSRIEQIEVGIHVESFEAATVSAMRQNPNIILIGEMRDLETIQNAITLAETGHVVYGTMHAKSVTDSIERIVDVFPHNQQDQIRSQLAGVLKGIIHQTLISSVKCGIVPLVELLRVDGVVESMILAKQKANAIRDHLRGKSAMGNVHVADNAAWHIREGRLTLEDVKPYLNDEDNRIVKSLVTLSPSGRSGFGG